MLKNVFLFTGEEAYLLDKELKRRKEGFLKERTPEAVFSFDIENFDSEKITQAVFGSGLFTMETFIVLKGLPLDNAEGNKVKISVVEGFVDEFMRREGKIPEGVRLIFVSYKADKRSKLYKFLNKNATVKEFSKLRNTELTLFIKQELGGLKADDEVIKRIIYSVGDELYRLNSELEKLRLRCTEHNIDTVTTEIVDNIVFSNTIEDAFKFFGILFKDKKRCMNFIAHHQEQGINWNMFSGLIYRGLKLYINILDMFDQGITDSKIIAEKTGANPFVLRTHMGFKDKIQKNSQQIRDMFTGLVRLDSDIKMGKKSDIEFWLELKKMVNEFE